MNRFAITCSLLACLLFGCGAGSGDKRHLAFDGGLAFNRIEDQVAFGPRVPGQPGHTACENYLLKEFSASADSVWAERWEHPTVSGDTLRLANICASFNPAANARILLCAHWDSRPVAEHDPDPALRNIPIQGANDGGSGVAVLLELARVFGRSRPSAGVDIALFDGEDYGDFQTMNDVLLGSRYFAEVHKGYNPRLGILLDMVGGTNAAFPLEGNSWASFPDQCNLVWDTAAGLGYGRYFPRQAGAWVIDDHIPLIKSGIRCIDIIQMGLPYWHTTQDTPYKCSPATLEAVGRTLAAVVYGFSTR